jgi:hypothetical protein
VELIYGITALVAAMLVSWLASLPFSGSVLVQGALCGALAALVAALVATLLTTPHPAGAPEKHVVSVVPYGAVMGVAFACFSLGWGVSGGYPGAWGGFFAGAPAVVSYGLFGAKKRRMNRADYLALFWYVVAGGFTGLLLGIDEGVHAMLMLGAGLTLFCGMFAGRLRGEHLGS